VAIDPSCYTQLLIWDASRGNSWCSVVRSDDLVDRCCADISGPKLVHERSRVWLQSPVVLYAFVQAIQRILVPTSVDGRLMTIVASAAVFINIILGAVLHTSHSHGSPSPTSAAHVHGEPHHSDSVHAHADEKEEELLQDNVSDMEEFEELESINLRAAFIHVVRHCGSIYC
jgi:hypothetical protein